MITLKVKTIREALRGFSKLNLRTCKDPILLTVRFKSSENRIRLSATDLDQQLTYHCQDGISHEDSEFLIPIAKLRSCCKGEKPETRLHFHPETDRHLIHIDDGVMTSEIGCEVLPINKYPGFEAPKHLLTEIPAFGVRAIQEATGSASDDPNRYILNGVLLEPGNVVATNGRILYRSNSLSLDLKNSLILPNHRAITLLDPNSPVTLYGPKEDPRGVYCMGQGDWDWFFRAVDGTYPNYNQVIPRDETDRVVIELSKQDLELFERVARLPFAGKEDAYSGFRRVGKELRLMVGMGDDRQVYQLNPVSIEGGQDLSAFFNFTFLMEGVKNGMRTLTLKDELAPLIMKAKSKMQLFMPLRGNQTESDWKVTQVQAPKAAVKTEPPKVKPPEKVAACATKTEAVVQKKDEPKESEEDPIAALIREATELRDTLKDSAGGLTQLIKTARRVSREHGELEKDHLALKKSVRSLQKIEV